MAETKKFEQALPVGFRLTGGSHVYIIEQVLGQGGFGITYKVKARIKAGNITVTTHFAVKEFFPSSCWRNEGSTSMLYSPTTREEMQACLKDFIAEGQRLQRICSINSNIVSVNEVFEANNTAYFVMEYLSGGDLRKLVKDNGGGLPEEAMINLLTPVAQAIECLHENHMLHLDIKPENIVMRQSDDGSPDVPVLIDFGISVHFTSDGAPTTTRPSKGVTQGYSPVEQFAGVSCFDPRLDVYALSATCYFLLTGRDPKSAFELTAAMVAADLQGRATPMTIDNIVRGMSKEAQARPATVGQFMQGFIPAAPAAGNVTVRQGPIAPPAMPGGGTETRLFPAGDVAPGHNYPARPAYPGSGYGQEPRRKSSRGLIIALSALATILVIGLATWGVIALTGNDGKGKKSSKDRADEPGELLDEAIGNSDKDMLLEYAEMDSVRAYYPLAILYEDEENFEDAMKWAKKALYSDELSESELRRANKLVDRLNNALADTTSVASVPADSAYYAY